MRRSVPPNKRSVSRARRVRPRSTVEPTRLALSALERLKELLDQSGKGEGFGAPRAMSELSAQASLLGADLPSSYVAALRVTSQLGGDVELFDAARMLDESARLRAAHGREAERFVPFAREGERLVCFDRSRGRRRRGVDGDADDELAVYEYEAGAFRFLAHGFAEWLDLVADARVERAEAAARIPKSLKRLLFELGFRFDVPLLGRVETADVEAIEALVGRLRAARARGDVDRLFDATGKAKLVLDLDDFSLTVTLRDGAVTYGAEDAFRWLRWFRDENFFGDAPMEPSHPDNTRDLRRAPREPPLVLRGSVTVPSRTAQRYGMLAAAGDSAQDFYLLGRSTVPGEGSKSAILHVIGGQVKTSRTVDEPLEDLYLAVDGSMWGLGAGRAVRISGGTTRSYPLLRPTFGRASWHGIGGGGERVLAWGAGALLAFQGDGFSAFEPDAALDGGETVVAVAAHGRRVLMLVCGHHLGAVAEFDGKAWLPIGEELLIEGALSDLDVFRGEVYVLDKSGVVWTGARTRPRRLPIPADDPAVVDDTGVRRVFHGIVAHDGGVLVGCEGGVLALASDKPPLFHAAAGTRVPLRLARLGPSLPLDGASVRPGAAAVVAVAEGHAWLWRGDGFEAVDLSAW